MIYDMLMLYSLGTKEAGEKDPALLTVAKDFTSLL